MSDQFAPVTTTIGFLRAPLVDVSDALLRWRSGLFGVNSVSVSSIGSGAQEALFKLAPLGVGHISRELLVETANSEWAALFDNSLGGTEPATVGVLSEDLGALAVIVSSRPEGASGALGVRQFHMLSPQGDSLGYARTIDLVNEGDRWSFETAGEVQAFEDVDAYKRRKMVDRLTSEMLVRYCAALGLRPFDADFYSGPSILISNSEYVSPSRLFSFAEARRQLGID